MRGYLASGDKSADFGYVKCGKFWKEEDGEDIVDERENKTLEKNEYAKW